MVAYLEMLLLLAAGAPVMGADCPSAGAVAAELERLGSATAVAAVGTAEIRADGDRMHVVLRGLDGAVSGVRDVAAPSACAERAKVVAVLVSAWVGAWQAGAFPDATKPVPPSSAHARPRPERAPPADAVAAYARHSTAARPFSLEAGVFGFGVHDGDTGTLGAGFQAGYPITRWLGIAAMLAGSGERERAMARGAAAYRVYDAGLGLAMRRQSGPLFGDLSVLPQVTLLAVEGKRLQAGRKLTRWGAGALASMRVGLALSSWRPFVFASTSWALRAQRLVLDDYPAQSTTLSRWNVQAGLGLAYLFGSLGPGETKAGEATLGLVE